MSVPPTIEYQAPPPSARRPWTSVRMTVGLVAITAALHAALALPLLTRLEAIFKDFNLKLPGITQLYLDVAGWWTSGFGWLLGWLAALGLPVLVSRLRTLSPPGNERGRWLLTINLILLAFILIAIVTGIALFMPMVALVEGVSSKK